MELAVVLQQTIGFAWVAFTLLVCTFIIGVYCGIKNSRDMSELQDFIGNWQARVFGQHRGDWKAIQATFRKFQKEIDELDIAIGNDNYTATPRVVDEIADAGVLLLGLCDKLDINLQRAIENKMKINVKRTWMRQPDNTFQHE